MHINVKPELQLHFFEEPPLGTVAEFWVLGRWKPKCKIGDELFFHFDKQLVASAKVYKIEPPGQSCCAHTGNFRNSWKVFWLCKDFKDLRMGAK